VGENFPRHAFRPQPAVIKVTQFRQIRHFSRRRIQAIFLLQLPRELLSQQRPRITDEALKAVTGSLIELHVLCDPKAPG
jgi:hypothetical protein